MLVWTNARKDIRRRLRDPTSIVVAMVLPAALVTLLIPVFGRAPRLDDSASVLIANAEASELSARLVGLLEREPLRRWVELEHVDEATGRERVADGDADALYVFAPGEPNRLELVVDQRPLSRGRLAERAARVLVQAARWIDTDADAEAATAELARTLNAGSVELETSFGEWARESGAGFTRLCFPSFLFLALFLLAQGLSDDLWRERDEGTLLRSRSAPGGVRVLIAGKLLAGGLLFALLTALNLVAAKLLIGVDLARAPRAILWCSLSGMVLLALFFLLQIHAQSARAAAILTSLAMLPLMMLGGGIFPFEFMPDAIGRLGRYTPNGWALTELREALYGSAAPTGFALACALLALTVATLALWLVHRVRTSFGVPR